MPLKLCANPECDKVCMQSDFYDEFTQQYCSTSCKENDRQRVLQDVFRIVHKKERIN